MSLRCNFCTLADSWTPKCLVLCHLFRCFDPRFKENALCHPAFVIRDINICRNSYSQGRLKSRKSYHCCKVLQDTDFLQHPPQNIPPFLSTLRGTIPKAIHDAHGGQTQKSNATSGFRRLELRKSLKRKPARLLQENVIKIVL